MNKANPILQCRAVLQYFSDGSPSYLNGILLLSALLEYTICSTAFFERPRSSERHQSRSAYASSIYCIEDINHRTYFRTRSAIECQKFRHMIGVAANISHMKE